MQRIKTIKDDKKPQKRNFDVEQFYFTIKCIRILFDTSTFLNLALFIFFFISTMR